MQLQRLWSIKDTVIPIIISGLGAISDNLVKHLRTIGIPIKISCLQNAALLGTVLILQRALSISESKLLSNIRTNFLISNGDTTIKKIKTNNNNNNNNNNPKDFIIVGQCSTLDNLSHR